MKSARTAPPGDNRATWATAFEAAPLTKPPALRGVSDCVLEYLEDRRRGLEGMVRVLRAGGHMLG
jgi:hypothetical protein